MGEGEREGGEKELEGGGGEREKQTGTGEEKDSEIEAQVERGNS